MTEKHSIPAKFTMRGEPVGITAAPDATKRPRFAMVLNSGKPFTGWGYNAILDLAGLELAADQRMPMLRQHKGECIAGLSDKIDKSGPLRVEGDLYPETAAGAEVLALSAKGFPWKASFGVQPAVGAGAVEWIEADKSATVNGHAFADGLVIRRSKLVEGSFVPIGADDDTSAIAAADGSPTIPLPPRRTKTMPESTAATIAQLLEAFPDAEDQGFVIAQLKAEATLEQANAAYNGILKDRLKAAKAAPAAPAPAAAARAARLPVATAAAGNAAPAPQSARDQFMALVDLEKSKGKDVFEARIAASGESLTLDFAERVRRRALHAAYITEANGGREWTPMSAAR